jgi:hypothetical protein
MFEHISSFLHFIFTPDEIERGQGYRVPSPPPPIDLERKKIAFAVNEAGEEIILEYPNPLKLSDKYLM